MKKLLLSIVTISAFNIAVNAQNVNITDAGFKAYLVAHPVINTDADPAEISVAEAAAYTGGITYNNSNITDLTGLEAFTSLTFLVLKNNNSLVSLDLSLNTAIESLDLTNNYLLSSINISQNSGLTYFVCNNNDISSLDVSQNINLESFTCIYNDNLSVLDVSQNISLIALHCYENNLNAIDVSQNTLLEELDCSDNNISSLDVSQNNALTYFYCYVNDITVLNMRNVSTVLLTEFNAELNPNLICIEVDDVALATASWTDIDPTASFSLDCGLGINENGEGVFVEVYPNPVKTQLFIDSKEEVEAIEIRNSLGQKVKKITSNYNSIEVSDLEQGVYFLQIQTGSGLVSTKFIKE